MVTATPPRFLSRGHTYRAVVGDTLVLPCEVQNLGKYTKALFKSVLIILFVRFFFFC